MLDSIVKEIGMAKVFYIILTIEWHMKASSKMAYPMVMGSS